MNPMDVVAKFIPKYPPIDFGADIDTTKLNEKSVLITGGASWIGLACARAFASNGAVVTIADIQQERGQAAADELTSQGFKVQFVQCDTTDYDAQVIAFKSAIEFGGGGIDIVLPSAGIVKEGNLNDMAAEVTPSLTTAPPKPGLSALEINLQGVYFTCYLALHYFHLAAPKPETFKKTIILLSSLATYMGYPPGTTYSASKFGVRGLFYGIRDKAFANSVRINLVSPMFVETPMVTGASPEHQAPSQLFGFVPMHNVVDVFLRLSTDEEIARRSVVILREGCFDAGDNIHDGLGGAVMQEKICTGLVNIAIQKSQAQKQ